MIRISYELGKNIATMRRRSGLTQTQLADQLTERTGRQISMTTVSNWERGLVDVPASLLPDICHIIHCTSWQLYPHSETLTDRDVQLIRTIKAMGEEEKADLWYLLHEWDGDRKAMLKLDVMHAVQSKELRYEPDRAIIDSYMDAIRRGGQDIDTRIRVDLDYVRRAFRHLLDD